MKSLVNFPQVLATMSEKLDVTQKLDDAFLAQHKDVLDAIQRLRAKARARTEGYTFTASKPTPYHGYYKSSSERSSACCWCDATPSLMPSPFYLSSPIFTYN